MGFPGGRGLAVLPVSSTTTHRFTHLIGRARHARPVHHAARSVQDGVDERLPHRRHGRASPTCLRPSSRSSPRCHSGPPRTRSSCCRTVVDGRPGVHCRAHLATCVQLREMLALVRLREVSYLEGPLAGRDRLPIPRCTANGLPDQTVAARLQQDAKVIVSPGYQFGPAWSRSFPRLFARDEARWAEALGPGSACSARSERRRGPA